MTIVLVGLAACILYLVQFYVYQKVWNRRLKVTLKFEQESITEGCSGNLLEVIENRKYLPLPMLKVKFQCSRNLVFSDALETSVSDEYYRCDIFSLMPYQKITRKLEFTGKKRGYYTIRNVDYIGADLFLEKEMLKQTVSDAVCYVYPKNLNQEIDHAILLQISGEIQTRRHYIKDPFEYTGIREYQDYDEMKYINWKATARTGELKVNEPGYTARNSIRIFLNLEDEGILKKESHIEDAIRLAATLCTDYLKQGMRVSLYSASKDCVSKKPLSLRASTGTVQVQAVYQSLARLDTAQKPVDFTEEYAWLLKQGEQDTVMTLFLSVNGYDDFQEFLKKYAAGGESFYWLYVMHGREKAKIDSILEPYTRFIHTELD